MTHKLKILPHYFSAVLCGDKTFEIRDNRDRGFQRGDVVVLQEWEQPKAVYGGRYTGREIEKTISYVTNYEQKEGFVVFGIKDANDMVSLACSKE